MPKRDLVMSYGRPRVLWLCVVAAFGFGCFVGPDRVGWPCNDDGDCGRGAYCLVTGVCADNGTDGCGGGHAPCASASDGTLCIAGGAFIMGSVSESTCGGPVRSVCMPTFYLDRTETTVADYRACVTAGVCTAPHPSPEDVESLCNWDVPGREDHPVVCVDWTQADQYCAWRGKRLPTAAEWEKGARGPDGRLFPWGDDEPTCDHVVARISGCPPTESTMPVGSRSSLGDSPYGAVDMMGNVTEWNADWSECPYDPEQTEDPQGPELGSRRVLRGGSWRSNSGSDPDPYLPDSAGPDHFMTDIGFRCARDPL